MNLIILADDLTGAADCAARCHQAGLAATIRLPGARLYESGGAICCTTDSRHLPADLAVRRVHELAAGLGEYAGSIWYKKIDSTLRGHLGQELDALLDALGRSCALVCPAFPAQRRGLADGYLVTDPALVQPMHLPTLLAHQSRRSVAAIGLADVRGGVGQLTERLRAERARGAELLVADALDEADLHMLLEAALFALPDALLCGSAGLAGTLAMYAARQSSSVGVAPAALIEGAALLVIGSGSAMAQRQIAYLRRHQLVVAFERTAALPADPLGDILLHLPAPAADAPMDGPAARRLAEQLALAAQPLIDAMRPGLLVLSGGDTAISVLARMGVTHLLVQRELLPGVPLTCGMDASGRSHMIVLKAGNHGDQAALATVLACARFA
ncbi:MAG: four-carbon acid sugar kinase family protein [Roseiflexaceae bacterium]